MEFYIEYKIIHKRIEYFYILYEDFEENDYKIMENEEKLLNDYLKDYDKYID